MEVLGAVIIFGLMTFGFYSCDKALNESDARAKVLRKACEKKCYPHMRYLGPTTYDLVDKCLCSNILIN